MTGDPVCMHGTWRMSCGVCRGYAEVGMTPPLVRWDQCSTLATPQPTRGVMLDPSEIEDEIASTDFTDLAACVETLRRIARRCVDATP